KQLNLNFSAPDYELNGKKIKAVNASASIDSTGTIHISLVNLDATKTIDINTDMSAFKWAGVEGSIITSSAVNDHNTFGDPQKVRMSKFNGAKKNGDQLLVKLPPHAVITLTLK
ncbi:MAG TPA: alpha-L-arabinofuranosidase C-terminal domain-containing protein, partial [Pedobacter sp.]|nr:alpha-L-arabinofuranosidase C-terminal domain-containing protein [Pedobacter sp.]